ncbi:MAG TPA: amidohydrolase family protein [Blastocatellia bacterium]|nr:amidohydrolase family protein [Blastocatellia bacterium]
MLKKITPFGDLEVFDAHTHFFSHKFFETLISQSPQLGCEPNAIERVGEMTGWTMPPRDPAELAAIWASEFDRHGVSGAMMIASVPGDEESVATAVAALPDRIAGAFMFDPTKPDAESRARRAFDDSGLRLVCLFPAMHRYSIAENEGARIVAALTSERPGTAVFVHCGALSVGVRKKLGLPSLFDMRRSNPLEIYSLAAEFSKTKFIIPHFGAGMFRETMMLADLCPNVYLDTSSTNKWVKYEAAAVDLPMVFKRAIEVVGCERLIFGTDSSFFPRGWVAGVFDAQVDALSRIGASDEQARAIFGGSIRRLLNLT